jgi:hypothetical protein
VSDTTRSSPSSKWRRSNPLFCVWEETSTQTCCTCASCSSLSWQVQQRWSKHVLSTENEVNTSPLICTRSYILPDENHKIRGARCVRIGYS